MVKRIPLFIQYKQVVSPMVLVQPQTRQVRFAQPQTRQVRPVQPQTSQVRSVQTSSFSSVADRLSMKGLFVKTGSCKACSRK